MVDSFEQYLKETKQTIENHLNNSIESINAPKELKDSMLYSLMAGGKRLRPILLLLSYQSYKSESEKVITSAIALERSEERRVGKEWISRDSRSHDHDTDKECTVRSAMGE